VDVTGNITAKLCEVWSEFNIFCTLVTMTTAFAAFAMETKKRGFKIFLDSFHQTS
jgi:hypothetical protein